MKKILVLLSAVFFMTGVSCCACNLEGIYDGYQAVYSPSTRLWSVGSMVPDRVVLTKKSSAGSGSYSEYYYPSGKMAFNLGSNYEFIANGRLIAVHNADLKFFEVYYDNKNFSERELTSEEVQKLFPNTEIIKISDFTDKKICVKKKLFKSKKVLLLNDTDRSFYKYSFSPLSVKISDVAGLIKISRYKTIKFSHFGDDTELYPAYTIKVKKSL